MELNEHPPEEIQICTADEALKIAEDIRNAEEVDADYLGFVASTLKPGESVVLPGPIVFPLGEE